MIDLNRIKANVAKMASMNAPEQDIDGYIASEGTTIDDVRSFQPNISQRIGDMSQNVGKAASELAKQSQPILPKFSTTAPISDQETITPSDIVAGTVPMKALNFISNKVSDAAAPILNKQATEGIAKVGAPTGILPPISPIDIGTRLGMKSLQNKNVRDITAGLITDPRTYLLGGETPIGEGRILAEAKPLEALAMTGGPTKEEALTKAQKLATEILQPSTADLTLANQRGRVLPAVEEAVKSIGTAKTYGEAQANIEAEISKIMNERNALIKQPRLMGDYTQGLQDKIDELVKMGHLEPSELKQLTNTLQNERNWMQNNPITREGLQSRKEALQKMTESVLAKNADGIYVQPNRKMALDLIRKGIKESVEAGESRVAELNSRYGGLLEAKELLVKQAAIAQKAIPENMIIKIIKMIRNPSGTLTDLAVQGQEGLLNKTKKIQGLLNRVK